MKVDEKYFVKSSMECNAIDDILHSDINYSNALRPESNPDYNTRYDNNPFLK